MKKIVLPLLFLGLCTISCDETTNTIGIYTDADNIESSFTVFDAYTKSIGVDSVLSNSYTSYLGKVNDPETNTLIKAEFLAQFNTLEGYKFPDYSLMVKNENGKIEADSIELRLYYKDYYGADNNPMKIEVLQLDTANTIQEGKPYYSNADLMSFVNPDADWKIEKVFTIRDFTLDDETLEDESSYTPHMRIMLPKEYGSFIINKYYENPDFFKNSYNFIRHVCPGFYFHVTAGIGTMASIDIGAMNVYFKYKPEGLDTIYTGVTRFAATPEVIQKTSFENSDLSELVEQKDWTYLKTPAGIFTEMTIPVEEIYKNHEKDSISQAKLSIYRYNSQADNKEEVLGTPQTLLMVRKQDMHSFFEEKKLIDSKTSYLTSFNESYNSYTFSNIGNLVAYCRKERNQEAAKAGITPEEWSEKNPDWNKVVLVPVSITQDNSDNVITISHDMGLNSARLVGGEKTPVKIQVIYSRFN